MRKFTLQDPELELNNKQSSKYEAKNKQNNDDNKNQQTKITSKIIKATITHVRDEILSSPNFLSSSLIAMRADSQDQVDAIAINACIELLHDTGKFKDFVNEHTAELKSKVNKNKIKTHII